MIKRIGIAILSFFGLIFIFVTIRNGVNQTERRKTESATVTAPASAVPAAAPQPTPHQTYAVATFTKSGNVLDECAEVTFWTDKKVDPKKLRAFLKGVGVPMNHGCEEAFPDRTVFASCVSSLDMGDAGISVDVVERYYNALMLDNNDTYMKNCFETGGSWKAMAHDDPEYTRARLRGRAKDLVRATEQLQQAAH